MNWDQIEGKWKQFGGRFREKWGKLTEDDWNVIAGKRDQLVGRIQERYGMAREQAQKEPQHRLKGDRDERGSGTVDNDADEQHLRECNVPLPLTSAGSLSADTPYSPDPRRHD